MVSQNQISVSPVLALNTGSKRRLRHYLADFSTNRGTKDEDVLFDPKLMELVRTYARDIDDYNATMSYLRYLRDEDGIRFCANCRQYSKLKEAAEKFSLPDYTSFRWNRNYQEQLKELKKRFSHLKLTPLSYTCDEDIRKALPKEKTHSGFTFIETGRKSKGLHMKGIFSKYQVERAQAATLGSFNRPMIPNARTQVSGAISEEDGKLTGTCKHKSRLIFIVDLIQIIAETEYAKPFQDAIADHDWYAGGKDCDAIRLITMKYRLNHHYWLTLDYKQYDASLSKWIIEDTFDIIKCAFSSVDEPVWNAIVHDFIHKDLEFPDGVKHYDRGVPSGSMFTQIVDSVANLLIAGTYLKSKGLEGKMIVMGDDNSIYTKREVDRKDVASYILKNFGIEVSAGKCVHGDSSTYPTFLSRVWTPEGEWRHPRVLLSKMAYPERFRVYGKGVTPELVLLGYINTFYVGMCQLIDVPKFLADHPELSKQSLAALDSRYIPGALAYIRDYTMRKAA